MSKAKYQILVLIIVLTVLFGLLVLPGLASTPKASLPPNKSVSSPESWPRFSAQLTFTPVMTIYLPTVLKVPSAPGCDFYEPNDTPQQANLIQNGETQTHCIVPKTDSDWVKFSVNTESQVVIELSGETGETELRLYNGNLNQLEFDYSFGDELFSQIDRVCGRDGDPLAAGTYYARVEEWLNNKEIPNYNISLTVIPCPTAVVLANHSSYTTTLDDLIVVGEVQNNEEVGIRSVNLVANLFNDDNQLIDTGTSSVYLDVLPPDDKTCFTISLNEYAGWSYYEFEKPTYNSISGNQLRNMTVYNDSGTYVSDEHSYRVVGFVRNDNNVRVEDVQPIVTLYNTSGQVIGCGYTYVNSDHLNPGQSSSFELTFSGYYRDYSDVASYRIQVDGSMP